MDKKRYRITFEFETDDFVDECDLEVSMEHMFPDWKKINVEEIVPKCKENAPNQSQKSKVIQVENQKAHEDLITSGTNIHTQIKKEILKDYE
jgi:hypothetical protein